MKAYLRKSVKSLLLQTKVGSKLFIGIKLYPYLERIGWLRSLKDGLPFDRDGNCLPWITYPIISFLNGKKLKDLTVFEYGSGNSTMWWSKRVSNITSCEHDFKWYNYFKEKIPSNVNYKYCELDYGGEYSKIAQNCSEQFNIIVIDGRDRVNCAKSSLTALNSDGVIIWDNSDREKYREGYTYLLDNEFKRLDFEGLGPNSVDKTITSIFYRTNNCFQL